MADASTDSGEQPITQPTQACHTCKKTDVSMSRCARCDTLYCSRSCQIRDWKTHKKTCARTRGQPKHSTTNIPSSSSASSGTATGLQQHIPFPFTGIDNGTYLHNRPQDDVYKLLIDTYRLRMDDSSKFDGIQEPDSLYARGVTDAQPGFRRFLGLIKARNPKYLPDWWNDEKQTECEAMGATSGWSSLQRKIDKAAVIAHYGSSTFPMQLRMFAEMIYQRGLMGQDGTAIRRMMMQQETGNSQDYVTMLDTSSMFH